MRRSIIVAAFLIGWAQLPAHSQNVAVELLDSRILYKYAPNEIKVVVENTPCEKVVLMARNGTITRRYHADSCHYMYWSYDCNAYLEQIKIGVQKKNSVIWIDSVNYQLKDKAKSSVGIKICGCLKMPDEQLSCKVRKEDLLDCQLITAPLINWDIDLNYEVLKYSVEVYREGSFMYRSKDITQCTFTKELSEVIEKALPGETIRFYNILVAVGECEFLYEGPVFVIE